MIGCRFNDGLSQKNLLLSRLDRSRAQQQLCAGRNFQAATRPISIESLKKAID
jgi:hypothetical protein